jgi:uncharacterized damage-inducible protein DinB
MARNETTAPDYYQRYIKMALDQGMSLEELLSDVERRWQQLFAKVDDEKADKAYEEGKWTLKELLQHVIDVERVMCYRAMMFARGSGDRLAGFDHDAFAKEANANNRTLLNLLEESAVVRSASIHLFKSFSPEMMKCTGHFSNNDDPASTEALGLIIAGHQLHHMEIVKARYL